MRLNARVCFESRKRLDEQLQLWEHFAYRPRKGWIKAIREALGMSSRQLAENLGKTNSEILAMERREEQGKVTLQTLEKAASALRCRFVYALVPEAQSLEVMVHAHAEEAARRIVMAASHSMTLEDQQVVDPQTQAQIKNLAFELERKLDPRIWSRKG